MVNATIYAFFCFHTEFGEISCCEGRTLEIFKGRSTMAKKKKFDFEPYEEYKNCFVNAAARDWLNDEKSVSHYMPYHRLESWIDKSAMTFVSPSKWEDPFEKIYLDTALLNFPSQKSYTPPQIVCLCFTKNLFKDSVAFWNSFKNNESTQLVRVVLNFKKMVNQLINSLKKRKMKIYIAAVDYLQQQKNMISTNKNAFVKHILDNSSSVGDAESFYMKMLSCKRKAFAFEKEIRIMLVSQNRTRNIGLDVDGCYPVKIDFHSIVQKIWLEPIRIPTGWVSEDLAKERLKKMQDKIQQSPLYEKRKKCTEIDFSQILTTKKERV